MTTPLDAESLLGRHVTFAKTISESDVYLFAGITGDLAAYHVNAETMRTSRYGGRIAHGVLVLGLLSTASTLFWQSVSHTSSGVSLGYDHVRFLRPVFLGDTLTAHYELTSWDGTKNRYTATGEITNQHKDVCLVAQHLTKAIDVA